jgi:hypothetical protein
MLRRIPSTPLVCLCIFLSTIFISAAWASAPDESLEVLLRPNQVGGPPSPVVQRTSARPAKVRGVAPQGMAVLGCPPPGITKVKAECVPYPGVFAPPCILPQTRPRQWELSVQTFFARSKGSIQWPRNNWWTGGWGWQRDVDLNDDLQLPAHNVFVEFNAKYQFRPNWSIRYSVLADEINGGGSPAWNANPFWFGNFMYTWGQPISSKWQHSYQRIGLAYDAVKNCTANVSLFAGWMHADDRIDVNCWYCGNNTATFSKSMDCGIAGIELQRCLKTAANGATLSCDSKASAIFLDDAEGYDVQAGARYSIPLNAGRWGFVKGGYRVVELKKTQNEYLFKNTLEGGYVELGFIF